jgi:outer membrane immunogenic protein
MKKILLAGIAAIVLASAPALAADAPRPYYKAPPVYAPMFNWTGFYIGGHVGGQWGSVSDLTFGGGDPQPGGWLGGVLGGYNWQAGPWVFGIEGDAGWGSTSGSNVGSGGFLADTDIRFVGNLRARLGWAIDRVLLFVAGGGSWANMRVTHTGAAGTVSETLSGWTIGAGADFAVTPNLILRAEYLYADYGSSTFGFAGGFDPHAIDLRNNIIRGAAIWKF